MGSETSTISNMLLKSAMANVNSISGMGTCISGAQPIIQKDNDRNTKQKDKVIRQMIRDSLVVPIVSPAPESSEARPLNPQTDSEPDRQDPRDIRSPQSLPPR